MIAGNTNAVKLTNEYAAPTTAEVDCSYGGGCPYTLTGASWFATLENADATVTVCGRPCVLDKKASDKDKAVCKLPLLPTLTAITDFNLVQADVLKLTYTGTADAE